MRTTVRPTNSGWWSQLRQPGPQLHERPDHSEKRARPSDFPPIHPLHRLLAVHELPHAPGQPLRESVPRLHLVGPGDGRRAHVSEGAARSHGRRAGPRHPQQSRGRRRPRSVGRSRFSRESGRAESEAQSTRSSPTTTATAGFSAPFSSRTKRATGSISTTTSIAARRLQERRPPEGHPPCERHAVRRLPLRGGGARQRTALRRAAQCHDDHVRRLPRHR